MSGTARVPAPAFPGDWLLATIGYERPTIHDFAMKRIAASALRVAACILVFFAAVTFVVGCSHVISDASMRMVGPAKGSYLFKTSLFLGVQFAVSGAIYLAYKSAPPLISKSSTEALFFSRGVSLSGFMHAIIPVIAIPVISIVLAWASRKDVAINGIMRWELLPISAAIVIVAAAIEEFLFRGMLLRMLLQYSNSPALVCLISQSAVFALFHGEAARASWLNFFGFFCVGLLLGLVYQASKVLWAPVLVHSWSNIWSGLLTGGSDSWFAGLLFNEAIDYFTAVKRFAVVATVLLLLRSLQDRKGLAGRKLT